MKTVAILATLDTKGKEVSFMKDLVQEQRLEALIIDTGIYGPPLGISPDISREEVAGMAGLDGPIFEVARKDRGRAISLMMQGGAAILAKLQSEGRIHGALSIGGSQGTAIASAAMQALPVGFPKLIVSTVASGKSVFGPYVGTKDIAMVHSVADILGINAVTRRVLGNAVLAVAGMVNGADRLAPKGGLATLAITMYGTTTKAVMRIKEKVEADGRYELVAFHPNGTGGRAMEEMIEARHFAGVLDLTIHEIVDELVGGNHAAGPNRLEAAGKLGIPQLVAPGGLDQINLGAPETIPAKFKGRKMHYHNPLMTFARTSPSELTETGRIVAEKLNRSRGPVKVILPLGGFSDVDRPGMPLYDPEADMAFAVSLKKHLKPQIEIHESKHHINDPEFADQAAAIFLGMLEDGLDSQGRKGV